MKLRKRGQPPTMKQTLLYILLVIGIASGLSGTVRAEEITTSGQGRKLRAADIINALKNSKPTDQLDYSGLTIEGNLNLFELPETLGQERVVLASLNFTNAVFLGSISTWDQGPGKEYSNQPRVRFRAPVNFGHARFMGDVNFDLAIFEKDARFSSQFHEMGSFTDAIFEDKVSFHSAQFDGRALFRRAIFRREAEFAITIFKWIAFFDEARFAKDERANFLYARFLDYANFSKVEFNGIARFVGTQFQGPASFSDAKFHDQAWFAGGARFDNTLTFRRAEFFRTGTVQDLGGLRAPVLFNGVIFSGEANFADSKFKQVDFGQIDWLRAEIGLNTTFKQRADFRNTEFEKLGLRRVSFQDATDFTNATFRTEIDVTDIDVGRADLYWKWSQLTDNHGNAKFSWQVNERGTPEEQQAARSNRLALLSSLKAKFQKSEALADAGEVHYFVEDSKRRDKTIPARWLDTVFLKGIFGYGVRPSHQIWTAILLISAFALIYGRRGVLRRDQTEPRKFRLRVADFPVDWTNSGSSFGKPTRTSSVRRYLRALEFSSSVFIKVGFGGIVAARDYRWIVIIEAAVGAIFWFLLLYNLSNRWPLLHKLITTIS